METLVVSYAQVCRPDERVRRWGVDLARGRQVGHWDGNFLPTSPFSAISESAHVLLRTVGRTKGSVLLATDLGAQPEAMLVVFIFFHRDL